MSVVTTVVLLAEGDPEFGEPVEQAFNFTGHSGKFPMNMTKIDRFSVAATKVPETDIFVGAFNYFDHEGWFAHLDTLDWRWPDQVVAVVTSNDRELSATWTPRTATPHDRCYVKDCPLHDPDV